MLNSIFVHLSWRFGILLLLLATKGLFETPVLPILRFYLKVKRKILIFSMAFLDLMWCNLFVKINDRKFLLVFVVLFLNIILRKRKHNSVDFFDKLSYFIFSTICHFPSKLLARSNLFP
jgi:hypothetical protein